MKKLFTTVCVAATLGLLTSCGTQTAPERTYNEGINIIPMPASLQQQEGRFLLSSSSSFYAPTPEAKTIAEFFAAKLKNSTGFNFAIADAEKDGGISLLIDPAMEINEEGYRLDVTPQGVKIQAKTPQGVFYGMQSFLQLLPAEVESPSVVKNIEWSAPCVSIDDAPRFAYRGMMLDPCRHFIPVENVKKQLDVLSLFKINTFHWHLTDDQGWRIEIKKYPELTTVSSRRTETVIGHNSGKYDGKPYGGFYTQEQAREIVDYAAERYITVIPEVDLPGHMQAALAAYPYLGCTGGPYEVWRMWGVSEEVLCAGNDSVLTFIDDVLTEIMEIFPSEYIHVGGDECPKVRWEKCPKCQARIKALGLKSDGAHSKEERLQSFVINHIEKFLNDHGRQIIGWDEILEGGLAPNATVMSWRGEKGGIEAAKQKHDVIMTPNTYLYFDYYQAKDVDNEPFGIGGYLPLERVYSYEPMPSALSPEEQKFITGVQANLWTEYIPTMAQAQYMVLPRMAALCETQWSAPEKKQDYQGFLKRTARLTRIYQLKGWNYATHIFDVNVHIAPNTETGKLDVTASTIDDAPVYYTLDGTEPTTASSKYENGLTIDAACVLRMMAVRPEGNSRITRDSIAFSKSTAKPITMLQPINKPYEFKGATTLVDGMTGDRNYKTGRWIAFYKNDMEAVIDLKEATEISSMTLRTCVEKGDWTFDTRGITVEVSDDNKTFRKVASEAYPAMKETDANQIYTHTLTFDPVKTRYVKVTALSEKNIPAWHGGKGNPGFLFVDEIVLN